MFRTSASVLEGLETPLWQRLLVEKIPSVLVLAVVLIISIEYKSSCGEDSVCPCACSYHRVQVSGGPPLSIHVYIAERAIDGNLGIDGQGRTSSQSLDLPLFLRLNKPVKAIAR